MMSWSLYYAPWSFCYQTDETTVAPNINSSLARHEWIRTAFSGPYKLTHHNNVTFHYGFALKPVDDKRIAPDYQNAVGLMFQIKEMTINVVR